MARGRPPFDGTDLLGPLPHSRLTALSAFRKEGSLWYHCVCACGQTTDVSRINLLRAYPTRSCGCLAAETREKQKRYYPYLGLE